MIETREVRKIVEAALLVAGEPLSVEQLERLFVEGDLDSDDPRASLRDVLGEIETDCSDRGYELVRVASGYRFQVRQGLSEWISRLWEQKPPRYSRALLETLALIAYRQPATRGDIEEVRGVSVSANIMRTLIERGWVREVGHRDVPGRPALYATTRGFLDYFNLKSLSELPPLSEVKALIEPVLFQEVDEGRDAVDDGETLVELETEKNVVTLEGGANESPAFDDAEEDTGATADELELQSDGEQRPLAEVVKLPTPD